MSTYNYGNKNKYKQPDMQIVISEHLIFKIFLGGMPSDPLAGLCLHIVEHKPARGSEGMPPRKE